MSYLCMGCMNENEGESTCPNCGTDKNYEQIAPHLPLKTLLNERYVVGKVLRYNTESAIYVGYDKYTSQSVYIKEFFPHQICTRAFGVDVVVPSDKYDAYNSIFNEFLMINDSISKFKDLTALIEVLDLFKENNTAYLVYAKEDYLLFREFLERSGGTLDWDVARPLFMPVLSALSKINKAGLSHLGISADNLVVSSDGKMKLFGFSIMELHKQNRIISPVFYSGSTAPEQYNEQEILEEDTDVYSFTATLFYALTGKYPSDSRKRVEDGKLLISTNVVKRLPPHVVSAIANGLQTDRKKRIQDFEVLRAQLSAAPTVKAIQEEIAKPVVMPDIPQIENEKRVSNKVYGIVALIVSLIIFSTAGFFWLQTDPFKGMFFPDDSTNPTESTTEEHTGILPDETYPPDSEYYKIPNYVSMDFDSAVTLSSEDGQCYLNKTTDGVFSDTVPEGHIVSQFPEYNTTVEKGRDGIAISVTLSLGKEMRELPEVANSSLDKVASDLAEEHFVVSTTLEFSDTVPENTVISYADGYEAGKELKYGSEVEVIVSLGPQPESPTSSTFSVN